MTDEFHEAMASHRPQRPDLMGLRGDRRTQLNQQYRFATAEWLATSAGRKIVGQNGRGRPEFGEVEADWPQLFCAECYAGTAPEFAPYRGLDSYGDCAEDGEPVYWTVPLSPQERWKHLVFNVLVDECGANEGLRPDFMAHWPGCREFRFSGALGYGGKVFHQHGRTWVTCYSEDETADRLAMIDAARERLDVFDTLASL